MAAFTTRGKLTSCHKDHKATKTDSVYPLALYTLIVWFSFEGDFFLPQGTQNKVEGPLKSESNGHQKTWPHAPGLREASVLISNTGKRQIQHNYTLKCSHVPGTMIMLKGSTLKKQREMGEIIFNNTFYLTQYISNLTTEHAINIKITELWWIFCTKHSKSSMYFTHTAHINFYEPHFKCSKLHVANGCYIGQCHFLWLLLFSKGF